MPLGAVTLASWMGIHVLRTFWAMLVWNIAEDRSPPQIALIALVFWGVGMLAWIAARRLGGPEPARRFGALFAVAYVALQGISHPTVTPVLAVAATVLWFWFFPSLVVALGRRGAAAVVLPGLLAGLAAQVALQTALNGLDMPVLHGRGPGLGALALVVIFYYALISAVSARSAEGSPGEAFPGWGLLALGPYLLLEMTLLANLGRVGMLSGWDLRPSAGLILIGLAGACARLLLPTVAGNRIASGVLAVLVLLRPAWLAGSGVWLLVAAQVLLAWPMAAALGPHAGGRATRVYGWMVAAAMIFFVLTFLYYRRYGWPLLWPVMAALAVLPSVIARRPAHPVAMGRPALAVVVIVALAALAGASRDARPSASLRPAPADLTILDYNIHEAFNVWSIPDPEATARTIERADADIIALQEVGRGWNINGGPDLLVWLRWRFPEYQVVFAPILGDLVGLAILSRYAMTVDTGRVLYPRRRSRLSYGLQWATIPTVRGDLLFVNTHLSPYEGFADDRAAQAGELLDFWKGRARTIIVGDLNAGPAEAAVRRLLGAGLVDLSAAHGLATAFTYSCDQPYERRDYILSTPDVDSLAAAIPRSTASDHCPVEARVRLR